MRELAFVLKTVRLLLPASQSSWPSSLTPLLLPQNHQWLPGAQRRQPNCRARVPPPRSCLLLTRPPGPASAGLLAARQTHLEISLPAGFLSFFLPILQGPIQPRSCWGDSNWKCSLSYLQSPTCASDSALGLVCVLPPASALSSHLSPQESERDSQEGQGQNCGPRVLGRASPLPILTPAL